MPRKVYHRLSLFLVAALLAACGQKIEPGTTPAEAVAAVKAPIATAVVTQQPFMYEAVGTVAARTASTIASKLMGVVRIVHVQEGDRVREGDLLVTLDPRQVKAQLDRAQANAAVAEKEYNRYKQLLESQSASQQEFDRAEAQFRQSRAAVAAARVSRKDALVRAPYNGRVVTKLINPGDLASPGTPFFTLEAEGRFWTDLVLPERHIQAVQTGLEVQVVVPALENRAFVGRVARIIPMADTRSRSFQIKVAMPDSAQDLKSGMFARVAIPLGGTGMLLVPKSAVKQEGQLDAVYVLDAQQTARMRLIRIGQVFDAEVEVLSGLSEGQRYVAAIPPGLTDGARIEE